MKVKKNLMIIVITALLVAPALSYVDANASGFVPDTKVATGRLTHSYDHYPAGTLIYDGHGHNQTNQPKGDGNGALGHPYDSKHPLVNIPEKYVGSLNSKIGRKQTHLTSPQTNSSSTSNPQDNSANSGNNSSANDMHKQLVKQRRNKAFKKAGITGVATAAILFVLYGFKRLIQRNK